MEVHKQIRKDEIWKRLICKRVLGSTEKGSGKCIATAVEWWMKEIFVDDLWVPVARVYYNFRVRKCMTVFEMRDLYTYKLPTMWHWKILTEVHIYILFKWFDLLSIQRKTQDSDSHIRKYMWKKMYSCSPWMIMFKKFLHTVIKISLNEE